jgi:hypothetical protein
MVMLASSAAAASTLVMVFMGSPFGVAYSSRRNIDATPAELMARLRFHSGLPWRITTK